MKRLFLIAGLMAAFLLVVVTASAQKANFAGAWSLDKAKSQGLSPRDQGADKVTLTITQDATTAVSHRLAAAVVARAAAAVADVVRLVRSPSISTARKFPPK
jgi:hypothetical protein